MNLRIGTSEIGGTFYTQALALKNILKNVRSLPPVAIIESTAGASIENALRLEAGELDLAFISAPWVSAAKKGVAPFATSLDLKTVAPMNLGPNFFVARADSDLHMVRDLRGRRLAIGLPTSGMTPHAEAVLQALGIGDNDITKVHVGFAEGARRLISGEVDAQYQRPIPNEVMTDLCRKTPVRVLRFDPHEIDAALQAMPCDQPVTMKAGALPGLDEDISQLGVLNLLVAHRRAEDEIVRLVVEAILGKAATLAETLPLFADLPELLATTALQRCASLEFDGVTLHPGAARAYAAAGYINRP